MPIYEYRCSSCGHQQEFLQKLSDPPRTQCTQCGKETFSKMVTAAGFQLKGSGWYVTDFRGGNTGAKEAAKEGAADAAKDATPGGTADGAKADAPAGAKADAAPAATAEAAKPAAAAPAAAPAAPKAGA